MWRRARRPLSLLLALLLGLAALVYQRDRQRVGYTRYDLPTYDAFVYVAMADEPAFFTAAPWGYRLLEPLLVHQFLPRMRLIAFREIALQALVLAAALLFLFLRRLGHGTFLSLLAMLVFCLSRPVGYALAMPMLGEPVAVVLEIAVLLAVACEAPLLLVAALLALGGLVKEIFLLLIPLVLFARLRRRSLRDASLAALLTAAPLLATHVLMRAWWTPGLQLPRAPLNFGLVQAGLEVLSKDSGDTLRALLLRGVLPLAVLGAFCREARPYLAVFGYLAAATVGAALFAWINVPSPVPVPLFGANTERILIYALPLLLPLALTAFERGLRLRPPMPSGGPSRRLSAAAALLLLGVCVGCVTLPFAALDPYRRLPLHASRDGPLLMAFCRESLRVARTLERGDGVVLDLDRTGFTWGEDDPGFLYRMRWFLREGWGPLPHYGDGPVTMRESTATLVLPCMRPRDLEVTLVLQSALPGTVRVFAGPILLGDAVSGPAAPARTLRVPARALRRGDNLLTLLVAGGAPGGVRLRSYALRAAP